MTRYAVQIATKRTSRIGIDHPVSIPSSHLINGRRQRAGSWSDAAANAEKLISESTVKLPNESGREARAP
ncbi:hypothetical protein ACVW1C_003950 [Bradyrhizobium sp. USDA 4011]